MSEPAIITIDTSHLECKVCFEVYDGKDHIPYVLCSCGHTFCHSCIKTSKKCYVCQVPNMGIIKNWQLISALDLSCERVGGIEGYSNFEKMTSDELVKHIKKIASHKKNIQKELFEQTKHKLLCVICDLLEKDKNIISHCLDITQIVPNFRKLKIDYQKELKNFFDSIVIENIKISTNSFIELKFITPKIDITFQND